MAFENSTASSPVDLVQKLKTFLVANGWTLDSSVADGVGWRVHIHKGAQYVHLRASTNEVGPFKDFSAGAFGYSIALYLGTAYVGGNAWNNQQAGAPASSADATHPVGAGMRLQSGAIPNYYFFTDATNAHVVVVAQCASGIYTHMGWGSSLSKVGTWTGGDYFWGTFDGVFLHQTLPANTYAGDATTVTAGCPFTSGDGLGLACGFVRADVDAFTGKWISFSDTTVGADGYTGKIGSSPILGSGVFSAPAQHTQFPCYAASNTGNAGSFQHHQVSAQDGRANLLPCLLYAQRDGSGPGYSPLGTVPTIFVTSAVGQGFSPASDYVIGADTYTMFPYFAVKKVV
jgi:hypothetical protein